MRLSFAFLSSSTAAAALSFAFLGSTAAAQPRPPADPSRMVTDDCAKARKAGKQCVLTIESHEVDGGKPVGLGTVVTVTRPPVTTSLIRIRRDFIQEIVKSAEDL